MTAPTKFPRPAPVEEAETPESPRKPEEVCNRAPEPPVASLPYAGPVAAPKNEDAPTPDVIVGTWNGLPNWQCTRCPYSTVDGEDVIRQHIAECHLAEVMTIEQRARASGLIIATKVR